MIFSSADQPTTERALVMLKSYMRDIDLLRVYGRYALDDTVFPAATEIIDRAQRYCEVLGSEIGADTFLGANGTPAIWWQRFESQRRRVLIPS